MQCLSGSFSSNSKGFSLIEMMVVVAIVGILASIALPSYSDYVIRGRIPDATSQLAAKRVQMEQFFQDNQTYENGPGCTAASNTNFDFDCVTAATKTAYTLRASGRGSMSGFVYTVDQGNTMGTAIGTAAPERWRATSNTCWITAKGGAC